MPDKDEVRVESFAATFRNLALPFGFTVNEVKLRSGAAILIHKPFSIELEKPGDLEVTVSEAHLQSFLNRKAPGGLKDFEVRLDKGQVLVEASMKMIMDVRASAVCTLRIQEGKQLFVELESVQVMGVGAKQLVQSHLDKINPVMDVKDFPFEVELQSIAIDAGQLLLTGTASPK